MNRLTQASHGFPLGLVMQPDLAVQSVMSYPVMLGYACCSVYLNCQLLHYFCRLGSLQQTQHTHSWASRCSGRRVHTHLGRPTQLMLPHTLVKRRERSPSAESVNSTASNKRSNSGSSSHYFSPPSQSQHTANSRMAAMDINPGSNDGGSSSSSTEPLMSENGEAAAATSHAIPGRSTPPADGQIQLQMVLEPAKKPLDEGDTWFVVDRKWFRRWQAACGSSEGNDGDAKDLQDISVDEVGPVDNTQIASPATGRLLRPVTEGQDVVFLPGGSWHLLEAW